MLQPSDNVVPNSAPVLRRINALLGRRPDDHRFPAAVPVSVTQSNLIAARNVPHVLFPKSDGFHYILFATRCPSTNEPTAYMLARNMLLFRVRVAGPL
jgi:hypothetical protein